MTVFALQKAKLFAEAEPERWEPVFSWDDKPSFSHNNFVSAEHTRIGVAFISLLTRLGRSLTRIHTFPNFPLVEIEDNARGICRG